MKKILSLILILIILLSTAIVSNVYGAESQDLNYVDLNNWQEETFVDGNGSWVVQLGGRTVIQTENGNPTFFTSPETGVINKVIKGTISVYTTADDDMIGFVMGFQDTSTSGSGIDIEYDSDFIVFDWKQTEQTNPHTTKPAIEGYSLVHIDGYLNNTEYVGGLGGWSKYLWSHEEETGKSDLLGEKSGVGEGWEDNITYLFEILYSEDRIKIRIDGELIFDVDALEDSLTDKFKSGKIGFYNNSQNLVEYGRVKSAPGSSDSSAPVSSDDNYVIYLGDMSVLNVDRFNGLLANDYDPNLDSYSIVTESLVSNGTLSLSDTTGEFTYTPNVGFTGVDSFEYHIIDSEGRISQTSSVNISVVSGTNQTPSSVNFTPVEVAKSSSDADILTNNIDNIGYIIGSLTTDDPNEGDFHDYKLTDNSDGKFGINNNEIHIVDNLVKGQTYTIAVRSTDLGGLYKDQSVTINVNADYETKHYKQDVDENGYTLVDADSEILEGYVGEDVSNTANDYTGFYENIEHPDRVTSSSIVSDSSLTLERYYDRNDYTVTFNHYDDNLITTKSAVYEGDVTPPANPTRVGYTFTGWDGSYTNLDKDEVVTASYSANDDTEYTVNHYIENLDGNYELKEAENLKGTTDTNATAVSKNYAGFIENIDTEERVTSGNIEPDGLRVLKLYYDRNQYNIIYNTDGGTSISSDSVLYEQSLTDFVFPTDPTKPGYYLGGWTPSLPNTMPAEDITVVAQWIPEGETMYTVEQYQQNINDDGYTLKDTNILSGETDSTATAGSIDYIGFYYDEDNSENVTSGSIEGNGTLVLKLHYNREEYTVTFLNHDDETLKTESVRYEGSATPPPRPSRSGYDFKEWNEDYTYITSDVVTKATYRKEEPEPVVQESTVLVNGEEQISGTETSLEVDGEMTVTYEIKNETVEKIIEASSQNEENTLEIPIQTTNPDRVTSKLTGDIVKKLEDNQFNINIKTEIADYEIPAEEITISNVAKELGVEESSLEKIEIDIEITKASGSEERQAVVKGREEGYRVLITPVEFKVTARTTSSNGEEKEVEIKEFKNYVKRTLPIPKDIDPNKVTTSVLIEKNGNISHIPTKVYEINGRWYAEINSLTNSQYTLINNEKEVKGAENHWAKEAVEDLASRKIIEDTKYFLPDASISRGEFAEYITKALGIYRTEITENVKFTDVKAEDEHSVAIRAAVKYGIINGYPDGSFRPENKITREEAMVMYARAIKIAKIEEIDLENIQNYKDKENVSNWAVEEVKKTIGSGVFYGRTSETIDPEDDFTFAEAATAVRNLLIKAELINK